MSWQKVAPPKSRRTLKTPRQARVVAESGDDIRRFLMTFKTQPCQNDEPHDFRLCEKYHSRASDQRRNPYLTYYTPGGDGEEGTVWNATERMYHPTVFRTSLCKRGTTCNFGKLCAHAHSSHQLRNSQIQRQKYSQEAPLLTAKKPSTLTSVFESALPKRKNFGNIVKETWERLDLTPTSLFLPLEDHLCFVLKRSEAMLDKIRESALEAGLGTVVMAKYRERSGLKVKGMDPHEIKTRILSILSAPSSHYVSERRNFGERVIETIRRLDPKEISISDNVLLQCDDSGGLRVTAVQQKSQQGGSARSLLRQTMEKLEFWIHRSGLDSFFTCICCFDSFNSDQGIQCPHGHFCCSVGEDPSQQCFAMAVNAQIIQLHTREDNRLLCPECNAPYDKRNVAQNLPDAVFESFEQAVVDSRVAKQVDELNAAFDERLHTKVQEVLANYGKADNILRHQAQKYAKDARDTVLNLCCPNPNCRQVYVDFTGCMALQCASCNQNFCAYCHNTTADARGAHTHVRECLMNETQNGSYYATPEQIRDAQRRYRTREIKRFLRRHKKALQNAIIIELEQDLNDLGIQREALFELGNLMDAD